MTKIIFLDVDGVLNTGRSIEKNNGCSRPFDPEAISVLNKILKLTNANIVISSLKRYVYSLEQINELFLLEGLPPNCVIGTNSLHKNEESYCINQFEERGADCLEWIKIFNKNNENDHITKYAVIDDMKEILTGLPEETIFITDPFFGLTNEISDAIISYLNV